jgi:hypothetical protein
MNTSLRNFTTHLIGACLALGMSTAAHAQVAIKTGVNAQTECGLLFPHTDTVHAGDSMAMENQSDTETWPTPMDVSQAGFHTLKTGSLSETTAETTTLEANTLTARTEAHLISLLGGSVTADSATLENALIFNLIAHTANRTETLEVSNVTVNKMAYPNIVRHIPAESGDTPAGTSIPIHTQVWRTIFRVDGTVRLAGWDSFNGTLTLDDSEGSIDPPIPGQNFRTAGLYLKGHLGGALLLAPPCDVRITVGEIHANYGDGESAAAAH